MDFHGKTVCITGAAVGIGRACALEFARMGAKLALLDICSTALEALQTELSAYADPADIYCAVCDVSDEKQVTDTLSNAVRQLGSSIDILINNAALWRSFHSFMDIAIDEWKKFLDINVMGVVYCTRAVLPSMLEKRYGRILNVASVAGVYGNANMVHYSATKGAIISMTKALAKEVSDKGILVNAISPGSVSPAENGDIDYSEESTLSFMGRTGTDRENAHLICFLASDEASYIAGQNIQIDGCRKKQ